MATIAEIKALIQREVRQQRSHLVRNGMAAILDLLADGPSDGAAGGATLYSADGTLAGIRIVTLNGKTLQIQQGGQDFLSINPTAGSEGSVLRAFNATDNDNESFISVATQNTDATFQLRSDFNDGANVASIEAVADVNSSSITHTADTHTMVVAGEDFLKLDGTSGSESAVIRVVNPTDDDNTAILAGTTSNTDAQTTIRADFNNGVKTATIAGFADASSSTITHTADTHSIIGTILNVPAEVEFVSGTQSALKMRSPDNTLYLVTVENGGTIQITPN